MSLDLPPLTPEVVVEHIASNEALAGSAYAQLFEGDEVSQIDALGSCNPDPIVYSDDGGIAIALFECRGELGHFGMAVQFQLNDESVETASVMTINQIGDVSENG